MSQTTTHYLAISVGPLVDTILQAQQTRELWTASTLFSVLMKHLVIEAQVRGLDVWSPQPPGVYDASTDTFLAPAAAPKIDSKPDPALFGAGIYPDRLYASYESIPDGQALELLFKDIRNGAVEKIARLAAAKGVINEVAFYKDFFRIAYVWVSCEKVKENILRTLNDLLDTQELQPATLKDAHLRNNALEKLLKKPYSSQMVRDGLLSHKDNVYTDFTSATTKGKTGKPPIPLGFDFFPSTAQIASQELFKRHASNYHSLMAKIANQIDPDSEEDLKEWKRKLAAGLADDETASNDNLMEFYRQLENGGPLAEARLLKPDFHDFQKYFCIVHADGDRFGEVIQGLNDDVSEIKKFSAKLANFSAAAAADINEFGGKPILIGGDDLVFFAPAVYFKSVTTKDESGQKSTQKKTVTVFDLIERLDATFKTHCDFGSKPTLSYGLTISHYKYPLFEAYKKSFAALYTSKKMEWDKAGEKGKKDAVTFQLIRHSGSYFEGYMEKTTLKKFNALRSYRNDPDNDFLSSFTFKLRELEPLLDALGGSLTGGKLNNIINNFFDEPIHARSADTLDELLKFYTDVNKLSVRVDENVKSSRENMYALLRLMAFTLPAKKQQV